MYIFIFSIAIVAGLGFGSWLAFLLIFVFGASAWQEYVKKTNSQQLDKAISIIKTHAKELTLRRKQLTVTLNYGLTDDSKWKKEANVFFEMVIQPATGRIDVFSKNYDKIFSEIQRATENFRDEKTGFSKEISPIEYEHLVAEQLSCAGWETKLTSASGDQGIDVMAEKFGLSLVVQCKLYSKPVGNAAVQEAIAGKAFAQADYAAVVTNSGFTRSAKELAQTSGVLLLHHDQLACIDSYISPAKLVAASD